MKPFKILSSVCSLIKNLFKKNDFMFLYLIFSYIYKVYENE